jgi:streptogramin lyase
VGNGDNIPDEKVLVIGSDKIVRKVLKSSIGGASASTNITKGFNTKVQGTGATVTPFIVDVELPSLVPSSIFIGNADRRPTNLVLDKDKNIYTSNRFSGVVSKISAAGVSSQLINLQTFYNNSAIAVEDIAIDPFDNIYVTASAINAVVKISKTGTVTPINANGIPIAITLDTFNNVYVVNSNNTVYKITPTNVVSLYATLSFSCYDICTDNIGIVYVSHRDANKVTKIRLDLSTTTINTNGLSPTDLVTDKDNNIYVVNQSSDNLSKITPTGTVTLSPVFGNFPLGLTIDFLGNLYITNVLGHNVTKLAPDGTFSIVGNTGLNPNGIVIDDLGVIYTTNYSQDNVSKIVPITTGRNVVVDDNGKLQLAPLITPYDLLQKQNNLIAGNNITIDGNVISVNSSITKGYSSYSALINQSDVSAPTITTQYINEFNTTLSFIRESAGRYTFTSNVPLVVNKFSVTLANTYTDGIIGVESLNTNGTSFLITTRNLNGTFGDGYIFNAVLEIKHYN